ncbi:MAG TPA: DUF488 domain-containing protein [Hyphomicrobiaceae bacterium]|nr:DUF488 domain-containing protein [Hyphomicrobiaceae bacterium]
MTTAYTIGYEGTNIDRFVETLKLMGVTALADVRAVPNSRKKGFSKTALQARLEREGITYVHFVELGDPKPGREAARAGRYEVFEKIYTRHLDRADSEGAVRALSELAKTKPTCLLCFERDPSVCHRSLIANRLRIDGIEVLHLSVDDPGRNVSHPEKLPRHDPREGASAA